MPNCDKYIEQISASLDGVLSPDEAARLEAHLALCPQCRALAADLEAIHNELSGLPPVEVPDGLYDSVMAAIAADNVTPLPAKKKADPWKRWGAVAAAAFLVLVGAWGMSQGFMAHKSAAPASMARGSMAPPETLPENASADFPYEVQVATDGSAERREEESASDLFKAAPTEQKAAPAAPPVPDPTEAPTPQDIPDDEVKVSLESVMDPEATVNITGSLFVLPGGGEFNGFSFDLELTPREALDALLEQYPMPEDAVLVDTEDFLGWEEPGKGLGGMIAHFTLEYLGLSPNGRYHEFCAYDNAIYGGAPIEPTKDPVSYYAVSLDGTEILHYDTKLSDIFGDEAVQENIQRQETYLQATTQ